MLYSLTPVLLFSILSENGISDWIGDGFCDDINNNKACNYDGGDCCGVDVKKHFCLKCECIGEFENEKKIWGPPLTMVFGFQKYFSRKFKIKGVGFFASFPLFLAVECYVITAFIEHCSIAEHC